MDQTDEEQIQALRDWWRNNGRAIVFGVGLAVAGLSGWWGYGQWQEGQARDATVAYGQFLQAERSGTDLHEVARTARQVMDEHSGSGYAAMAALRLAARQMEHGEHIAAAEALGWVVENSGDTALVELARLRQARALAAAGREDEALALVSVPVSPGFAGAYADLRGDLLYNMGRSSAAVEAYREALQADRLSSQARRFIELKLGNLDEGA